MKSNLCRRAVLVTGLASFVAAGVPVWAEDKSADKLDLHSRYSEKPFVEGARQVGLSLTFDGKGGGWGTLTFDPNAQFDYGRTLVAVHPIPVQARLVRDDDHAAKGRRLYELREVGLEGMVTDGPARWLLVVPTKKGAPCSLMFVDKDGKVGDVLMLE